MSKTRRPNLLTLALCLAGTLLTAGCFESKIVTSKVSAPPANKRPATMNGVFYALPRTVVRAEVPVNRVVKSVGEFAEFKPCFFPNDSYVAKTDSTQFGVAADKIKFDTTFVPDAEQVYMIKTRGGMFETRNLELALTESGVFVKATGESTNQAIDVLTSTIKSGVGLLAKASGFGLLGTEATREQKLAAKLNEAALDCVQQLRKDAAANTTDDPALAARDTEVADTLEKGLNQKVKAAAPAPAPATTAQPTTNQPATPSPAATPLPALAADPCAAKNGNPAQCLDKFADALALYDHIISLQQQRTATLNLSALNATVASDTLKLTLDELDKTIKDLKQSGFLGTKDTATWTASYRLNPRLADPDDEKDKAILTRELFVISEAEGVCKILAEHQGVLFSQLDPKFKGKSNCANGKTITLDVMIGEDGENGPGGALMSQQVAAAQLKENGERGFFYRVPGRAVAFVYQHRDDKGNKDELKRETLSIAQFGEVVSLPASTGGRKTKYTLELYESSGGLKNFIMGSSALIEKTNVEDITGAAGTAIDAAGERKKANAPASELDQLKQQREVLEEKKKIRDLQKDLEEPAGTSGDTP